MNEEVTWHLWDRTYRPKFGTDAKKLSSKKRKNLGGDENSISFDHIKQGNQIRRLLYGDKEYVRYFDEKWGLDFLG